MSFSASKLVWGVKILLNQDITENENIGLYNVDGLSEFRWITNQTTTTLPYKDGVLSENGIGSIGQEADFTAGGNIAVIKGFTCSIAGSFNYMPIWQIIRDANINIIGKQIQVIEFNASTDPATETVLGTFFVDKINSWNEESYSFECVNAYCKRNTFISSQDEKGNSAPVLFGQDVLCKLVEIKNDSVLDIKSSFNGEGGWPRQLFPVVSKTTTTDGKYIIIVSLNMSYPESEISALEAFLVGKTFKIISGGGSGQYRTIEAGYVTWLVNSPPWYSCLAITIYDYLDEVKPYADSNASFIQFLDFDLTYNADTWPLRYTFSNYSKLVNSSLIPSSIFPYSLNADNNVMTYNATYFSDNTNIADNVVYSSCIEEFIDFSIPYGSRIRTFKNYRNYNGLYRYYGALIDNPINISIDSPQSLLTKSKDRVGKNHNAYYSCKYRILAPSSGEVGKQLIANIVSFHIDTMQDIDDVYLGLNFTINAKANNNNTSGINIYVCPVTISHDDKMYFNSDYINYDTIGNKIYCESQEIFLHANDEYAFAFNNIPSDYYIDKTEISSFEVDGFRLNFQHRDGHSNKTVKYGIVIIQDWLSAIGGTVDFDFRIHESMLLVKRADSLGGDIYTALNGRIYNDTWHNRVISTDIINNPISALEHIKRLERNDVDNIDFGHDYSPSVSIDTDTFDNTELIDVMNMKLGRQITSDSDQWTGKIAESLCKEFYLCSYQDNLGRECVSDILRSSDAPLTLITFSDIVPDSLSSVEEIGVSDIYCEPFISYAYNVAEDKFNKQIKITNTHKSTFSESYVIGLTGGEAERFWNLGRALYLKYSTVTQPPEDKTNLLWVYREQDATKLLSNWLNYMGAWQDSATGLYKAASRKRLSFSVPYDLAMTVDSVRKPWYVSMKMSISFPYHTSFETLYCCIESIGFDINESIANITVLTYDVTDELQFYIKDTYIDGGDTGVNWKNSYSTKAEIPANGNDVKDNT